MKYSISKQIEKNHKFKAEEFVLVYQMGKVGSSSIEHSLERMEIPSYHIHTFDDHEEFQMYKNQKDVAKFFNLKQRLAYRIILAYRKKILQRREELKIVTLIRDPIATVLSRFFQDLHIQFIEGKKNDAIHKDMDTTYKHLVQCFENEVNYQYFANWFDNELKRNFQCDVMSQDIDNTQPCFTFSTEQADILLIKCEHLNGAETNLADFLKRDTFELRNSNEASNKWYSHIYADFKCKYDFSKLFFLYDLPIYRHLYSPKEIAAFKQNWSAMPGVIEK